MCIGTSCLLSASAHLFVCSVFLICPSLAFTLTLSVCGWRVGGRQGVLTEGCWYVFNIQYQQGECTLSVNAAWLHARLTWTCLLDVVWMQKRPCYPTCIGKRCVSCMRDTHRNSMFSLVQSFTHFHFVFKSIAFLL